MLQRAFFKGLTAA